MLRDSERLWGPSVAVDMGPLSKNRRLKPWASAQLQRSVWFAESPVGHFGLTILWIVLLILKDFREFCFRATDCYVAPNQRTVILPDGPSLEKEGGHPVATR
jgi:hypothetical protein